MAPSRRPPWTPFKPMSPHLPCSLRSQHWVGAFSHGTIYSHFFLYVYNITPFSLLIEVFKVPLLVELRVLRKVESVQKPARWEPSLIEFAKNDCAFFICVFHWYILNNGGNIERWAHLHHQSCRNNERSGLCRKSISPIFVVSIQYRNLATPISVMTTHLIASMPHSWKLFNTMMCMATWSSFWTLCCSIFFCSMPMWILTFTPSLLMALSYFLSSVVALMPQYSFPSAFSLLPTTERYDNGRHSYHLYLCSHHKALWW